MPGMMDTVLNLGLNDDTRGTLAELTGNEWDGTNEENQAVASGIYVYLAEHDGTEKTGKIAVVR